MSLSQKLSHLLYPLQPLVHHESGLAHPGFPHNLLRLHLLTSEMLDALARFYEPDHVLYPAPTESWAGRPIDEQRQLFAQFIGLSFDPNLAGPLGTDVRGLLTQLGVITEVITPHGG